LGQYQRPVILDYPVISKTRVRTYSITRNYLRMHTTSSGNNNNNNRAGAKHLVRGRHSFLGDVIDNYFIIDNTKPKKMTVAKMIMNGLGLTGTGYLLYFRIGGWHANVLWYVMAAYWTVQFARACVKLYFEFKEGQIELKAKARRYDRDIFT
jgi:hypothetical protein